jgi:hypothetical protein
MDEEANIPKMSSTPKYRTEETGGPIFVPKINLSDVNLSGGKKSRMLKINSKRLWKVLGVIFFLLLIQGILIYRVYRAGAALKNSGEALVASSNSQDLEKVKEEITKTKLSLEKFRKSYRLVSWLKVLPYFGKFVNDGGHAIEAGKYGLESLEIVTAAAEPYADIIGFSKGAEQAASGTETAQDRLDFIVKTLPDLVPKVDTLSEKMSLVKKEIDYINPNDYPVSIGSHEVRERVRKIVELADQTSEMVKNSKPLLEVSPYLMGVETERTYLVLFQNDKELRPTGGFITAYSIAKVKSGKFEPVLSDDIYNLDSKYKPRVEAPQAIVDYIKGPYLLSDNLRLRDMNWSPDFSESMELFSKEVERAGISDIDGIIAVDTQVLVNILDAIGPIGVTGFGNFSTEIVTECNCPQVIYELESFADVEGPVVWSQDEPGKIIFAPPNYDNRKKIIGPLMNSLLSNSLGQSKEKIPALFEAGFKSLNEKHVLFYLKDDKAQKAVEEFGVGGTLAEYEGDYLHINDANLGGRKSNLYATQEVLQEIDVAKDGSVTKTLTITYKNPEKHDGWLNSVLPNWVRVYTPKGSELISAEGLEKKADPYEDLGKTVFAGYFELRPQGVAKVVLKYKLPFKVKDNYSVYVQKQPGKDFSLYSFSVGKKNSEVYLRSDKEFSFKI